MFCLQKILHHSSYNPNAQRPNKIHPYNFYFHILQEDATPVVKNEKEGKEKKEIFFRDWESVMKVPRLYVVAGFERLNKGYKSMDAGKGLPVVGINGECICSLYNYFVHSLMKVFMA